MGREWKNVEANDIKSLDDLEEIVRGNTDIKEIPEVRAQKEV